MWGYVFSCVLTVLVVSFISTLTDMQNFCYQSNENPRKWQSVRLHGAIFSVNALNDCCFLTLRKMLFKTFPWKVKFVAFQAVCSLIAADEFKKNLQRKLFFDFKRVKLAWIRVQFDLRSVLFELKMASNVWVVYTHSLRGFLLFVEGGIL